MLEVSRRLDRLLKQHKLCEGVDFIHATGGGAHKYHDLLERELGTVLRRMRALGLRMVDEARRHECGQGARAVEFSLLEFYCV